MPLSTPCRVRGAFLGLALISVLIATPAFAQVLNGDFEDGGTDWLTSATSGFAVSFPSTGGNPDGLARLGSGQSNPGGEACIIQTFECGEPGSSSVCTISFDYRFNRLTGDFSSSRLIVTVAGDTTVLPGGVDEWTSASINVPCGLHTLEICLEVDPSDNAWIADVDNVNALCTGVIPTEAPSWSTIKALYD